MPLGLSAYRALTTLAAPVLPLVLKRRLAAGKEHPTRWRERLGYTEAARPPGPLIWLHGASVGEGLSLLPLVKEIHDSRPDYTLLVTTGTVTSSRLLEERLPRNVIHQFAPVDTPEAARRFLDRWRPSVATFVESEVWPNLLMEARRRGVRTALVSARLSRASLNRWAHLPATARTLFGGYDLLLAQDDETACRLCELGACDDGRLNLKLCGGALPLSLDALNVLQALGEVLVAASTHPGEEEIVLDAYAELNRSLPLVLVPRHPERGGAIETLARKRGYLTGRRSSGDALSAELQVYVADTLGEMGLWYVLAARTVAFIGGSLVRGPGGHNPLEAARVGAPILRGPLVENWLEVYATLGDSAPVVRTAHELSLAWRELLDDAGLQGRRSREVYDLAEAAQLGAQKAGAQVASLVDRRP